MAEKNKVSEGENEKKKKKIKAAPKFSLKGQYNLDHKTWVGHFNKEKLQTNHKQIIRKLNPVKYKKDNKT